MPPGKLPLIDRVSLGGTRPFAIMLIVAEAMVGLSGSVIITSVSAIGMADAADRER